MRRPRSRSFGRPAPPPPGTRTRQTTCPRSHFRLGVRSTAFYLLSTTIAMFVTPTWAWWVSIAVSAHVTDFGRLQHTAPMTSNCCRDSTLLSARDVVSISTQRTTQSTTFRRSLKPVSRREGGGHWLFRNGQRRMMSRGATFVVSIMKHKEHASRSPH